jgi:hypothetical protein
MVQNGEHKPTVNGVIKGRPGKGKVYTLGQRAACYASHRMTEENTFMYTPKPTKGTPKPLTRTWCKRCRAASRKRSAIKRLAAAKVAARLQRKEVKAALDAALPNGKGKGKATPAPKPKAQRKASGVKARVSGVVKVACCGETFPDAPTASKHFLAHEAQKAKGKAKPRAASRRAA